MKKNRYTLKLGEEAEPYLRQAAWMARIVARISAVVALAVLVAAWMMISAMADSGFNPFEILITSALVIAALSMVILSVWLALKARTLNAAIKIQLTRKRDH